MRDGKSLAKVRRKDRSEIRDALRRLGSSESESLLYRGTISVEGIHDAEVLEFGFDDLLRRYRVKVRGGRENVEGDIRELQKAEVDGDEIGLHFFLFDNDRKPTSLTNSKNVRLFQLKRHCIENYLLDTDIITDLTREKEMSAKEVSNTTEMRNILKNLALSQIHEVAWRETFRYFGFEAVGFDMKMKDAMDASSVASNLWRQMEELKVLFARWTSTSDFMAKFDLHYSKTHADLSSLWDEKWRDLSDGKRIFADLWKQGVFKGDPLRLKRRIVVEMKNRRTETWVALEGNLRELLNVPAA